MLTLWKDRDGFALIHGLLIVVVLGIVAAVVIGAVY